MSKERYELTPEALLAIEAEKSFGDSKLILHAIKRYVFSVKKNAIIFTKKGDIVFARVRKSK